MYTLYAYGLAYEIHYLWIYVYCNMLQLQDGQQSNYRQPLLCATVQLDFVLAFPKAPVVRDLYMKIPKGFTLDGVNDPTQYVLKVKRNTYGGTESGRK